MLLCLRASTHAPAGACSSPYERAHMRRLAHAPLLTSELPLTSEHTCPGWPMLLNILTSEPPLKSERTCARWRMLLYTLTSEPPHTGEHTCAGACSSTYDRACSFSYERGHMRRLAHAPLITSEHTRASWRMLLYIRASLQLRAITDAPVGACSSTYEQASTYERTHMRRPTHALLHMSEHTCSFTYEHLSLHASLLLHIRAYQSPYEPAALHTST
ncbi:hypothetical protein HanOQP8_Chr11g0400381 [Helianthus annuus]|nr:hypothetical protein HanOQP8_Chr11g0400381 [Helianthus annuus]